MAKFPYLKLYVGDFLADTEGLTGAQSWAYMGILMGLWRHKGTLPLDHYTLRRMARCEAMHWPRTWQAISHFFEVKDGQISQRRLSVELDQAEAGKLRKSRSKKPLARGYKLGGSNRGSKPLKNNNVQCSEPSTVIVIPSKKVPTELSLDGARDCARAEKARASPRQSEAPAAPEISIDEQHRRDAKVEAALRRFGISKPEGTA